MPGILDLHVLKEPPADPFDLPVRAIESLFRYSAAEKSSHRIRVQGIVTMQRMGRALYVRDAPANSRLTRGREPRSSRDSASM